MPAKNSLSLRFEAKGRSLYAYMSRGLCSFLDMELDEGLAFREYSAAFRLEPDVNSERRLRKFGSGYYVSLGPQPERILSVFDGLDWGYKLDRVSGAVILTHYDLRNLLG